MSQTETTRTGPSRDAGDDVTRHGARLADGPTELPNMGQIASDGDNESRVETSKSKGVADGIEFTDEPSHG